jgi:gliding motility-associated-like protein
MYDASGKIISCASLTVIAKPPLSSFKYLKVYNPNRELFTNLQTQMDLYYRDWTTVSIPLTNYIGQNVTIEFIVSDCSRGGHMGYVYLDAKCAAIKPPQDTTICGTTPKKISTSEGFANYLWSGPGIVSGGNTKEVTVNRPGKYTVTLTPFSDNPCPITQTYIITQVCPSPVLSASFCESIKGTLRKDNINLASFNNLVIGTRTGLRVLSWHAAKPATNANKITNISSVSALNAASFYAVTDMPDTVQLTVTVNPSPNVTFAAIDTLCRSNIATQIAGVSPLGGVFSGVNVTSAGVFTPTQAGVFPLKYVSTNTFGCKDSSTKPVVVVAPATVVVSNVLPICSTTDSVILKSTSTNAAKVRWLGGLGTFKNPLQNNTIYYPTTSEKQVAGNVSLIVEATAVSPCPQVKDTVVFNIVPEAQLQLPANVNICATTDTLTILASSKNVSSINWSNNSGTITKLSNERVFLKTTGVGSVISVVAQGIALAPCTNVRDTLLVQFVVPAQATIDPIGPICSSTDSISLSSVVINAPKVRWTASNGVLVNKDSVKTIYKLSINDKKLKQLKFYLEVFSESPCKNVFDTIAVQVVPTPTLTLPDSIKLCSSQAATSVKAHVLNYQSVSWFNNLGVLQKTNDSLVVLNKSGITQNIQIVAQALAMAPCANIFDTTVVVTVILPTVQIAPVSSICSNKDSIVFIGAASNYKTLNWSGGSGTFTTPSQLKTRYQVAGSEIAGAKISIMLKAEGFDPCPNVADTTLLSLLPSPSTKTLDVFFCKESEHSVVLTADKGVKYNWTTGEFTQSIDVLEPNKYTVTLINEYGCEAKQIFSLEDICPPRLFVPNAFSPNGDGINDKFTVFGAHIGKYEFLIFSRWGEVIYKSTSMSDTWDGTYRDEPMPIGVYEWSVNYEGDSERYRGPYQQKGSVTVVK